MNAKKLKLIILLLLMFLSSNVFAETITIPLSSGRIYRLNEDSFTTVYIADNSIASLQVQAPGVFYLTGRKLGSTRLYATDKFGNVVLRRDITVVMNVAPLIAEVRKIAPNSNISVTTLRNNIVLRGTVPSPAVGANIREAAARFVGRNGGVIDYLTMSAPAQVYIRVKIVELSRGVSRMIGLKSWSLLYHNDNFNIGASNNFMDNFFSSFTSLPTTLGDGFNVSGFFEALDEDHLVRILSEPNLTALSGQQATFFAGGQFPILVPQTTGVGITAINTVIFQPFGVSLNFIPTLLDQNIINLQVKTEVSQLSNEAAVRINGNNVPSLSSRKASTTVQLRSGQSFAIAGLMQDNLRDAIVRFPVLGRLPVLGPLFNSREFQQDQTELVVIVTPYLVRPVSGDLSTPVDGVSKEDMQRLNCAAGQRAAGCVPAQSNQVRYITE